MCSGESGFYKPLANHFIYEYESMTDVLMHGSCVGYIYLDGHPALYNIHICFHPAAA